MGKLGKKARKFARKNLQSVLKKKRKLKSLFNKRASKKDERNGAENGEEEETMLHPNGRIPGSEDYVDISLDAIFSEDEDENEFEDDSESDGYLSEGSDSEHLTQNETTSTAEDCSDSSNSAIQDRELHVELAEKQKKLNSLKDKDPKFAKFLESYSKGITKSRNKDVSDDDEASDEGLESENEDLYVGKRLTAPDVSSLCQLAANQHDLSALIILLNRYRAACHYGVELSNVDDDFSSSGILEKNLSAFLMFMLREADGIFRGMLGISLSNSRKEAILELKKGAKWETLKPLIKSYFRSSLFLLNQVTDSQILSFALTRLKHSVVFSAAFPSLLQRFIKIAVHMWATGRGTLSLQSSLVLKEIASVFGSDCLETCLIKMYKAFISDCTFVDPALFEHRNFLMNSFVKLCSQDVLTSSSKAMVSVEHLSKIMSLGLRLKKAESIKKICSWQYINCIDLWVTFIAANIQEYDLQPLLYVMTQIINGMALLFPGSRYLPLRLRCIQWLNHLSSFSGIFIPVASYALDVLEYSIGKEGGELGEIFNISSNLKLPKNWLKSRNFQQECVFSAIEMLAVHFSQWSYHVSFPELATIPLIRLRKFHETTTIESFRRMVKRFIDQVEQNVQFVQKKRDEVAFSPKDQQAADSFLQLEKSNWNTAFTQYYKSLILKADSRNAVTNEKSSQKRKSKEQTHEKKSIGQMQSPPSNVTDIGVISNVGSGKRKANLPIDDGTQRSKKKRTKK